LVLQFVLLALRVYFPILLDQARVRNVLQEHSLLVDQAFAQLVWQGSMQFLEGALTAQWDFTQASYQLHSAAVVHQVDSHLPKDRLLVKFVLWVTTLLWNQAHPVLYAKKERILIKQEAQFVLSVSFRHLKPKGRQVFPIAQCV
jgi:hypothetical protein